jgi:hypothetical protein
MARVEVAGDQLTVQIEGMDKLWTFKSRLEIPLAHVTDAEADPEKDLRAGRQRGAVPACRRHQDLEPDAAGATAPARGVRPASGRLPRPPTNSGCRCLVSPAVDADAIRAAKCYGHSGQAGV